MTAALPSSHCSMLIMSLGNTGMMIPMEMESINAVIRINNMAGWRFAVIGAQDTADGYSSVDSSSPIHSSSKSKSV